jgi:hypothetical protein
MTEDAPPRRPVRALSVGPFAAFGMVAALAIGGAVWEMSYYATSSALTAASLGTTLGIVVAAIVFFLIALFAPSNE